MRPSKRAPDELRPITLERGVARYAEGSCLVSFGNTRVLCTASLEEKELFLADSRILAAVSACSYASSSSDTNFGVGVRFL